MGWGWGVNLGNGKEEERGRGDPEGQPIILSLNTPAGGVLNLNRD